MTHNAFLFVVGRGRTRTKQTMVAFCFTGSHVNDEESDGQHGNSGEGVDADREGTQKPGDGQPEYEG